YPAGAAAGAGRTSCVVLPVHRCWKTARPLTAAVAGAPVPAPGPAVVADHRIIHADNGRRVCPARSVAALPGSAAVVRRRLNPAGRSVRFRPRSGAETGRNPEK